MTATIFSSLPSRHFGSLAEKLRALPWGMLLIIVAIGSVGVTMLYSAGYHSNDHWAEKQAVRLIAGLGLLLVTALIDIRFWLRNAYRIYFSCLALLIWVEVAGEIGMGAQRWLDLYFIQIQPSELMKVSLILALAKFFHSQNYENIGKIFHLFIPAALILTPACLVLLQPDLGTAGLLLAGGIAILFIAGVSIWKFLLGGVLTLAAIPLLWLNMHDYQKKRVWTFLDPESDPLGSGYHIIQSKITLGSGGLWGKGYLEGPQSHLNFLPERHTDFIFTMMGEELGFVGGISLLVLFGILFFYGYRISLNCRNHFGRLLAMGLTINLFFYVLINTGMVMGLFPVVGVPLPLISYGGTVMISTMFSFGLIMSSHIHHETLISRRGGSSLW